jgi:hypothetical protein
MKKIRINGEFPAAIVIDSLNFSATKKPRS